MADLYRKLVNAGVTTEILWNDEILEGAGLTGAEKLRYRKAKKIYQEFKSVAIKGK